MTLEAFLRGFRVQAYKGALQDPYTAKVKNRYKGCMIVLPESRRETETDLSPYLDQVGRFVSIGDVWGIIWKAYETSEGVIVELISGGVQVVFVEQKKGG